MSRQEMLAQLAELDFYTADLQLYLNTHPYDRQAQSLFNAAAIEANELRKQYERMYGPLCARSSIQGEQWTWIRPPWPWQNETPAQLRGGDM